MELAALGRLGAEKADVERRRRQVEAECGSAERSVVAGATAEAQQLAALDDFRIWSRQESERLNRRRAECDIRIEDQRRQVLEARRRFRLLGRLRERRLSEWSAGFNRELENLAGELYLARRSRSAARST